MKENTVSEDAKGFYEEKGYVRQMVILPKAHKDKMKKLAKVYGISQGAVVEVLLDKMNLNTLGPYFEEKHKSKSGGKTTKTELVKKMKDLTPEQIAAIEVIIGK